jgi:peptidoglycan/LPS O-acetylase OafA/YrhL
MQTIEIVCCFTVISLFTLTSFVRQCCCQKKEKSSENLYLANVIVSRNLPLLAVVLTVWMIMVGLSTFREKLDYNFIIVNAGIGLIIFFSNNSIARDIRLSIKIQQSSSQ